MTRHQRLAIASAATSLLFIVLVHAQPPRVRQPESKQPEAKPPAIQPAIVPDRGGERQPAPPDWPQTRSPGTQRYEGRQSRSQGRASERNEFRVRPGIRPGPSWYLGVYDDRAPRGIRLTKIENGSPASRFGLESGDYILDVGGFVVGDYNGTYYPLSLALSFGTDPSGWAELLVWNRRTYAEETLWVQLRRR